MGGGLDGRGFMYIRKKIGPRIIDHWGTPCFKFLVVDFEHIPLKALNLLCNLDSVLKIYPHPLKSHTTKSYVWQAFK